MTPTEGTELFAESFQKTMRENGCLDKEDNIIMHKLEEAFTWQKINIQILSNALGNSDLREDAVPRIEG